jgi:RNA polymerase sigma-54 factor
MAKLMFSGNHLRQGLSLLPSAHLTQTMTLLTKNTLELEAAIAQEMDLNPALELKSGQCCPLCGRVVARFPCKACLVKRQDSQTLVFVAPRPNHFSRNNADWDDENPDGRLIASPIALEAHILSQLSGFSVKERAIAVYLIGNLDLEADGQLPSDICQTLARDFNVPLSLGQKVLHAIQRVDPVGLACSSTQESLLVQLEVLSSEGKTHPLASTILQNQAYLHLLSRKDYSGLASKLKSSTEAIRQVSQFLHVNLTPHPLAGWQHNSQAAQQYHLPDIVIHYDPSAALEPLQVEIYAATNGYLDVSPAVRKSVSQISNPDEQQQWQEKIDKAELFAKCLRQRYNALQQIIAVVVERQRAMILAGDAQSCSLTRAELATQLGLHESTVSRAIANKSAQLPNGKIVPISKFFDRALAVKDAVKQIIEQETEPLTDDAIANILSQRYGHHVARRTVAKYRALLQILPVALRKPDQRYAALP